jgi:signal peptidase II
VRIITGIKSVAGPITICGALIAADQLSKLAARHINKPIQLGFITLVNFSNSGAVFGLFDGIHSFLAVLSFFIVPGLVLFYRQLSQKIQRSGIILLIAGIIGNTIDRVLLGFVTDFFSVPFWPAFNLADSCIFTGAVLLLISFLPRTQKKRSKNH